MVCYDAAIISLYSACFAIGKKRKICPILFERLKRGGRLRLRLLIARNTLGGGGGWKSEETGAQQLRVTTCRAVLRSVARLPMARNHPSRLQVVVFRGNENGITMA
jgi:hypothetical protein